MAEGFFLGAAANAVGTLMVDYLVKPIERRICYLFRSGKIVEQLHKQKNNLNREQIRVKNEVEEAKLQIQTQVIEEYVDDWLVKADNALKDVEGLDRRVDENKKCCRWCPNLSWRYRLSKEMEKKTLDIVDLVQSSKFEQIGHRAELPNLEFMPSNDVVASKSSTVALNKIMDALKDEEVKMIGVWGMGGVGKTTLVTQVGNKVEELRLFNKVIIVVVSQTQSIGNIQNKIADFLNLKFEKTTLEGKANELWLRLEKEEKVLIVLDDIWNELNLKDIGIPLAEKGTKGCKIILTTRNKRVCESMECQVTVRVDVLGGEEAWDLFRMKANLDETRVSKDIIKEAKKVAEECKGLPVAIVTLASALKRAQTKKDWEFARKQLERSRLIEIGDIGEKEEKNAYLCIKTSYEYLKREETKRCFLLCALYPEDHLIDTEDLVRYAWGLQLYGEADSVEECRIRVLQAIDYLKDSCLLLEDKDEDGERCIKLHDIVRDVALWIASKEESGFLIKSRLELLDVSSEPCNAISLLNNKEKKFPERLMHPKLEIMLLNNCVVQGTCFQGMENLKVLSLSVVDGSPRVISLYALTFLQKLRTLILKNFEDFSFLGNLKTLEILILRDSRIMKGLEDELGRLENLKILDLTSCRFNSRFPRNVIGRMSKLEELYLYGSTIGHGKEINYIIAEINSLSRLTALSLEISYEHFREDFEFPKLERYGISIIGEDGSYYADLTEKFWKIKGAILLKLFSLLPENLKSLDVSDNLELTDLSCICELPTQHARCESLVNLRMYDCPSLKSLFTLSVAQSLVLLNTLEISYCHGLKQIVTELEGDKEEISSTINSHNSLCFPKLRKLEVENCEGLECLFPTLMAPQGLQWLRLSIKNCPKLKQVIRLAKDGVENDIVLQQLQFLRSLPELTMSSCPQLTDSSVPLEAKDATLKGVRLSSFKEFFSTSKHLLLIGAIEDHNLVPEVKEDGLNGLTSLELRSCNDVECLVDTTTNNGPTAAFTHLERIDMENMDGLESLCKGQPPQGFLENLKELNLHKCKKFQVLFQLDEHREENQDQPLSSHSLSLRSLKVVEIYQCSKLESLFSSFLIRSLVLLEELKIESCPELKTLFGWPENDGEVESESSSSRPLCLPKLKTLEIRGCSRLEYVVPITLAQGLTALESVSVEECGELKQVFGMPKEEEDGVEHDLHLPSLQKVFLKFLKSLTSFVPDNYTVKAPALKTLSILLCPEVMKVPIQQELNKQLKLELRGITGLSVFKELSCNSKDVILGWVKDHRKNMVPDVVDLEHLHGLTSLHIERWENCKCLVDTSQATMGLEPTMPKGFLTESQAPSMTFSKLEHLELEKLSELRCIVKGPTHCVNLQGLKLLRISDCNRLESLFSVSVVQTLRSLEELKIDHCDNLDSVFIVTNTLCSLPNLKTVEILHCGRLEYVFPPSLARGLPRLQNVKLYYLRSLSSIVGGNNFLEAPALEILDIRDCPAFQGHVNNCSTLKELNFLMSKRDGEDAESCNMVNTQLGNHECLTLGNFGQLFQLQGGYFISSLEKMVLGNSIWLRDIWKGPIHVATNLRKLEVHDCNNLTYVFPVMLIPHLPQLSKLKIKSCQNLKQIIANDDTWASSSSQGPQLEKKMIFPRLKKIVLEDLSRLESFSPVGYHMEFPCLEWLDVKKCLKMVTSFTVDYLTLTVHAQSDKASQLDDVSPSNGFIFWERLIPTSLPQKKIYAEDAEEISLPPVSPTDTLVLQSGRENKLPKLKLRS